MANDLAKQVDIFFEDVLESFEAYNVMAKNVEKFKPNAGVLTKAGQTFYRPVPLQYEVTDGRDITGAYQDTIEMTVPSSLNDTHLRNVPVQLVGVDLNDPLIREKQVKAANVHLSNKIDVLVANKVADRATMIVTNPGEIDSYEDAAECETVMLEQQATSGMGAQRCLFMNPRDARFLGGNLAGRQTMNDVPLNAYQRSTLPAVAGFDTFRADYMKTLAGSAASGYLVNGASQNLTPSAMSGDTPVDNRQQALIIDTGANIAVGDTFTIAGVNSVGHINKEDTGELKTFRVLADNGANWTISPAIIPADGTAAQRQYANVTTSPADNAVITILNIATTKVNAFFDKSAVEIIHGEYHTADLESTGKKIRKGSTDSGIQIVMAADSDIDTLTAKYRMFAWANVEVLNPEMCGLLIGRQV